MMISLRRLLLTAACMTAFSLPALGAGKMIPDPMVASLSRAAPTLNTDILERAVGALRCAVNNGASDPQRLAVIDFSLPSTERRLWIFDLPTRSLLLRDLVAHGRQSGENVATRFSNADGSNESSLGLFLTSETYSGKHGYSLRMDGLEPGFNDRARQRALVIHPADYVSTGLIRSQGRIGRSLGCPAVRPEVAKLVVDSLKGGQFVFSYYPDQKWLKSSIYLNCQPRQVASMMSRFSGS
jgi:hypothetical protein